MLNVIFLWFSNTVTYSIQVCSAISWIKSKYVTLLLFILDPKKSLKAFAINCKLGRVLLEATQVLGKLLGRKVVKKLIFLNSSSTCLIFFWFYSGNSSLGWGRAQDSNGGSHKMLSLYGTLEPLRLLLRVSLHTVVLRIRLASSRAAFSPLSPRALHQMATKKGPVAQAFWPALL